MIYYAKYHKDGNSFIIVDKQDIRGEDKRLLAQTLCRQDTKIGADSLIICDTSQHHISMVSYSRSRVLCSLRPLAAAVRSIILCFLIRLRVIKQPGNSLL